MENTLLYEQYEQFDDEDLVKRAKNGDEMANGVIFDRYKKVVRIKAQVYFIVGGDLDDSIQEGMIGLFRAIQDYNPEKESSFHSFAQICINRQILTAMTRAVRKKHSPLNSSVSIHQIDQNGIVEEALIMAHSIQQPEDVMLDKEAVSLLSEKIHENLSRFELDVIQGLTEGKTYGEIAEDMGKSKKSIDNAIQRIKRKVKVIASKKLK